MASIKGKILCIFSSKGGVGKTITALNLAGVFESLKKRTLLIDLDLYNGGLCVALNILPERNIYNLSDDLNNNRYKDFNNYITKYDDYIDVLGCPKDPRQANRIDSKYIEIILDRAKFLYDIILIDTTHQLNEINLITLEKSDDILFMINNDPFDLKNMKSIISIFNDLGYLNYKMLLNNCRDPYKNYFTNYDIKNLLRCNIDYIISSNFFIRNISKYVMEGKILTLEPKCKVLFSKDYKVYQKICNDLLINNDKDGENND